MSRASIGEKSWLSGLVTLGVLAVALGSCSRQERSAPGGDGRPAAVREQTSSDGAPAEEAAAAARPPVFSREGITVTQIGGPTKVSEVSRERARPTVSARADGDAVVVELSGYLYACSALPHFGARLDGSTLVIFRDSYTGSLDRCVGFHRATLRIEGVPPGSYAVDLRTERELPLASTTVVLPSSAAGDSAGTARIADGGRDTRQGAAGGDQ